MNETGCGSYPTAEDTFGDFSRDRAIRIYFELSLRQLNKCKSSFQSLFLVLKAEVIILGRFDTVSRLVRRLYKYVFFGSLK